MNSRHFSVAMALAGLLAGCGGGGGGGGGGGSGGSSDPDQSGTVTPAAVDYFPLTIGNGWSYSDGSTARVTASVQLAGQQAVQIRSLDGDGTTDEYYQKSSSAVTLVPGSDAGAFPAALGQVTLMRLPPGFDVAMDRLAEAEHALNDSGG